MSQKLSLLPCLLEISCVRPPLKILSRRIRVCVERGNIPYSAETHPLPEPASHLGTSSSTDAVQRTFVLPNSTRQEPSANSDTFGVIVIVRN